MCREITDREEFYERAAEWIRYYNAERPHLGIGGETPVERFEKIYGTNPSKLLSFNVIDIGALSTELILWFSQEAGHNVPAQYMSGRFYLKSKISCPFTNGKSPGLYL